MSGWKANAYILIGAGSSKNREENTPQTLTLTAFLTFLITGYHSSNTAGALRIINSMHVKHEARCHIWRILWSSNCFFFPFFSVKWSHITVKTTKARCNSLLFVPWMNISGDASEILAHLFVKLRMAAACLHISATAPGLSNAITDIQSQHSSRLIVYPLTTRIRSSSTWLVARKWSVQQRNKQIGDLVRDK